VRGSLREAGERLSRISPERRRTEVARLAAAWLKPSSPLLQKAAKALSQENGYPVQMARTILKNLFSKFGTQGAKKASRAARRLHPAHDRTAGMIFPSNVPDPIVVNAFAALLSGCAVLARFSERTPRFGRIFFASLKASRVFGAAVKMVRTKEEFFKRVPELDSVIAFGSDETIGAVEAGLKGRTRFVRYGHALSAGVLFKEALVGCKLDAAAKAAARDVWLYDQRGCFSPQIYFTEGHATEFADKLHAELDRLEKTHGRIRRAYPLAVERRVLIDRLRVMGLDPTRLRFLGGIQGEPVVYELKKDGFTLAATGQIIAVKSFTRTTEITDALGPVKNYIRCLAIGGNKKQEIELLRLFSSSKLKRICRPGQMQNPPISAVI